MIRINLAPEPVDFSAKVHNPGEKYLLRNPNPSSAEFQKHAYWSRVSADLHRSYRGICAYSCHKIPVDTGGDTIDHFKPKSKFPRLAYRWENYRLVCGRLNARKRDYEDVVDPFDIPDSLFEIDFPSLLIRVSKDIQGELKSRAESTIIRLKLNTDERCVEARLEWLKYYCKGLVEFDFIIENAPFLAREIIRKGLVENIKKMMIF